MKILRNYQQFNEDVDLGPSHESSLSPYNYKIDYTNLTFQGPAEDIVKLCKKADEYKVKSVCIRPDKVKLASEQLEDSPVLVCTVISFPQTKGTTTDSGSMTTEQKVAETKQVLVAGADEVDMVFNWNMLKEKWQEGGEQPIDHVDQETYEYLVNDIETLANICHSKTSKEGKPVILKVIVESSMLSEEQTQVATHACIDAGADFIKTSTGMVSVGAEVNKVMAMKKFITEEGSKLKIKASGGVNKSNVAIFDPLVDRFGMGFGAVDEINGLGVNKSSY
jgi:deoxyribose-phosphate aldolase